MNILLQPKNSLAKKLKFLLIRDLVYDPKQRSNQNAWILVQVSPDFARPLLAELWEHVTCKSGKVLRDNSCAILEKATVHHMALCANNATFSEHGSTRQVSRPGWRLPLTNHTILISLF